MGDFDPRLNLRLIFRLNPRFNLLKATEIEFGPGFLVSPDLNLYHMDTLAALGPEACARKHTKVVLGCSHS